MDSSNSKINIKKFIGAVIILVVSGLFLIWFLYGSIHPCGILRSQLKKDLEAGEFLLVKNSVKEATPVRCTKLLYHRFVVGPEEMRREINRSLNNIGF